MNKREYSEMVIGNRTVDELLHLYLTDQITDNPTYVAVTALLRKAVIREASVGKVSIKHVIAVGNFVDDAKITFSKRPQDRVWRDYDLIPKETP